LAGVPGFASNQREEAAAIGLKPFGHRHARGIKHRREHVGEVNEFFAYAAGLGLARPVDDQRDVSSIQGHLSLAPGVGLAVEHGGELEVRPVVAGENDQGVVADADLFELGQHLADHLVGVGDHINEVGQAGRVCVFFVVVVLSLAGVPVF